MGSKFRVIALGARRRGSSLSLLRCTGARLCPRPSRRLAHLFRP